MLILTKAFISIIQIFLITTAGYIFFRIRTFKQLYRPLLFYTVNFALPVLIIYRLITKFNFELFLQTLSLPLYGAFLIFWGYFVGKQLVPHMNLRAEKKNIFISLMMFSNIGYLPLPLFESVFQGDDIALAQIYVFFIALVYTSLIWSVGVNMLRHREGVFQRTKFKVTAPFLALLSGVALSFLDLKTYITGPVESVIRSVGTSGVYLVMFIMGGG
ncbi:MAG: AEC family transporter, partial [Spirochaetes bacterium]|nr:AEC family transporter [Spirochaetota bacterium]